MANSAQLKFRSKCPASCALDILGDKWSLLIIRDMIYFKKKTFNEFLKSNEKIATNISNNITIVDVFAYVPDRAEPPLAVVGVLDTLEYDTTMARGSDKYLIPVRLFVANVDGQDSQETTATD